MAGERLPLFNFYIDDSGTRHPDRTPPVPNPDEVGNWFALGGIVIKEEDEGNARKLHSRFCGKWQIDYPLHSQDIRHKTKNFSWLATIKQPAFREFMSDLDKLVVELPAISHACVIDRPGYHTRYSEMHGKEQWHLCKTAFSVVAERIAKFAAKEGRRVRVFVEKSDKRADNRIKSYYREMRDLGMPFDKINSSKYGPLSPEEMRFRLLDLDMKSKTSPMMQMADLFLYPICRGRYDRRYRPLKLMREHKKLVEYHLSDAEVATIGIKYSCFDPK